MSPPDVRSRRIAALWGRDLADPGASTDPLDLLREGYELLALDRPAATHLQSSGADFRTVEDWIDPSGGVLGGLFAMADSLATALFAEGPDALATDGVLWPAEDFFTIESLLQTAIFSLRLARAMKAAGVGELRLVTGYRFDPLSPNRTPHPMVAAILSRILGDIVIGAPLARPGMATRLRENVSDSIAGPLLRAVRRTANSLRFRVAARTVLRHRGRGRLVMPMLSHRELDRSGALVRAIGERFGEDVVVIPWMNSRALTQEAGVLSGLTWLPTPPMERGPVATERRFRRGIEHSLGNTRLGELEEVRQELRVAFRPLAIRWASHAGRLRWATRALRLLSPRLVIASRDDIEYQVPIEAARLVGVPTLTIPHGVVHWVPPHRLRPRPGVVHLSGIVNPTAPPDTLRVTGEALVTYEYPRRREDVGASALRASQLNVLVLTDGFGRTNHLSVDLRAHQRALRSVATAVRDAGPGVRAFLKPHPAMDERAERLLLREEESKALEVLPRAADLIEALGRSDLVVAINCIGSALVHTVAAGVPVVLLQTVAVLDRSARPALGHTALGEIQRWQEFWEDGLHAVTDGVELADLLRRMVDEPDLRRGLEERSHAVAMLLRPSGPDETITDIIGELLGERVG